MGRAGLADQKLGRPHHAAPKALFAAADFVTAIRLPLAAAFPFVDDWRWRLAFVFVAGASDVLDGAIARRFGSSKLGAVLDPVADKAFMLSAFLTLVITEGKDLLSLWEIGLVISRDLAATGAFVGSMIVRRPVTIPARLSGKMVTMAQFVVLLVIVLEWPVVRSLAWATGDVSVWAIVDYTIHGRAEVRRRYGAK